MSGKPETPRQPPPISSRRVRQTWRVRRSDPRLFPLRSGQFGHSSNPVFRFFGFFHLPLWSRVPEPIAPDSAIGALTDHKTCGILNNMDHVRPTPTGNPGCEPRGCAARNRARHSDFGTRPELAGGHGDRRGRRGQKWSPSANLCHNSRQVRPSSQPAPPRTHAGSGRPAGPESGLSEGVQATALRRCGGDRRGLSKVQPSSQSSHRGSTSDWSQPGGFRAGFFHEQPALMSVSATGLLPNDRSVLPSE